MNISEHWKRIYPDASHDAAPGAAAGARFGELLRLAEATAVMTTFVFFLLSCGGRVVVDGSDNGSGGTATASAGPTSSTTGVISTSQSSGSSICDNSGICEDMKGGGCLECAAETTCSGQIDACTVNPECATFQKCQFDCNGSLECIKACREAHPVGAVLEKAFIVCAVCFSCPNDCAGIVSATCTN